MTETVAGRMARTMPELGSRELGALLVENAPREWGRPEWARSAERAIRDRAEDAQVQAWAVLHHGAGSDAYWAALA